jgi:hypothetical protein
MGQVSEQSLCVENGFLRWIDCHILDGGKWHRIVSRLVNDSLVRGMSVEQAFQELLGWRLEIH